VVSRTSALVEIITADSGAAADNDPAALADAVCAVVARAGGRNGGVPGGTQSYSDHPA